MVAKAKNIHANMLQHSDLDMICLSDAVEHRFVKLLDMYLRVKGEQLFPPSYLDKDMYLWRTMRVRHMEGDYRNTEDEKKSTRRVAQWTMNQKTLLTGQEPVTLEWSD